MCAMIAGMYAVLSKAPFLKMPEMLVILARDMYMLVCENRCIKGCGVDFNPKPLVWCASEWKFFLLRSCELCIKNKI